MLTKKKIYLEDLEIGEPVSLGTLKTLNGELFIKKVDETTYETYLLDATTNEVYNLMRVTETELGGAEEKEGDPRRPHYHRGTNCTPGQICFADDCRGGRTIFCRYWGHNYYFCIDWLG